MNEMWVIILGMSMIGFNILMSYIELKPFLGLVKQEQDSTHGFIDKLTLVFRIARHAPKLIPSVVDILSMVLLKNLFTMGDGYAAGITGLFASNLLSVIIYFWVRRNRNNQEEILEC